MNLPTHTDEKVQEHHEGKYYFTNKRTTQETDRLKTLAEELDATQEWTVTRGLTGGWIIKVSVDAITCREARDVADEVTYAQNWLRGAFRNDHGKKQPEDWALKYQDFELVRG